MTRTEEFLSVLQPVGPEFLSRFTHHDDLYLSQSIDQVLKSQSMQYQRPGLSLATFWRHPSQEQIYFSVLSLPHHSPGHHWDLSGRSRVHLHCSIPPAGCLSGPGRVSAEERRLAAEEGSYSLKTWLRKISRGWASSSTGPQPRPVSTVLLSYLSLPTGRAWLVGYSWILWSINPPEPAVHLTFPGRGPKTGSRRRIVLTEDLAAEDPEEAGELQSWALPRLLVKSVLLSPTKTPFTRSDLNTGRRRHKDGSARRFLVDPAL